MLKSLFYIGIVCSLAHLSACQVINMVSVKDVKASKTLNDARESIITGKISQTTKNTLLVIQPKIQQCVDMAQPCMNKLHQINELPKDVLLSTGSELFLSHALTLKEKKHCHVAYYQREKNIQLKTEKEKQYKACITDYLEALNQSIRYSYAYLFATQYSAQKRLFNDRQVLVKDFYNQAIAQLMTTLNEQKPQHHSNYKNKIVGQSAYHIDLTLYPTLEVSQVDRLIPTYNLSFSGLNSISRRDGFGTEFVIKMLRPTYTSSKNVDYGTQKIDILHHPNIHNALYLPATVVVEPQSTGSIEEILNSQQLKLRVINPNQYQEIDIYHDRYPLAANFSAPYGLWLANEKFGSVGLNSLLNVDKGFISPQLFMLEPYQPHKQLVIMIHGLAGSPETWLTVSNDIMGDPVLREHYQVWQIFYSTNMPILENRYQIYHLLKQTFAGIKQLYPQTDIQNSVLIGHSMGGIISRLLVSNDDFSTKVLTHIQKKCHECQKDDHVIHNIIKNSSERLKMNALPEMSRAVFISAPFRGTEFADRWFTKSVRKVIKLPTTFIDRTQELIQYNFNDQNVKFLAKELTEDILQNGASDLSQRSLFMYLTKDTKIVPDLNYHIIIGNKTKFTDKSKITDGVVPYTSVHLEGAASEKIIAGGHSIQYTPEAVLELRRILHLHLDQLSKNHQ